MLPKGAVSDGAVLDLPVRVNVAASFPRGDLCQKQSGGSAPPGAVPPNLNICNAVGARLAQAVVAADQLSRGVKMEVLPHDQCSWRVHHPLVAQCTGSFSRTSAVQLSY